MAAPSHASYVRNRKLYLDREASPEGVKKRVLRDQARTQAIKTGKLSGKSDPREADHKVSLSKGGGNSPANIGVKTPTENRKKFNH